MVDAQYARGWDDCLEAVTLILLKARNMAAFEERIKKLHTMVKEQKFEKIRYELGVFDIF